MSGWKLLQWAFGALGCAGDIKHSQPCFLAGFDISVLLGIGIFWLPILAVVLLPVAVWTVGKALEAKFKERRNAS
jgi:hypothetical protein